MMLLLLSLVYAVSGTGSGSGPLKMEAIGAYCSGFDVDPAGLNGTGCSETTPFLYVDVLVVGGGVVWCKNSGRVWWWNPHLPLLMHLHLYAWCPSPYLCMDTLLDLVQCNAKLPLYMLCSHLSHITSKLRAAIAGTGSCTLLNTTPSSGSGGKHCLVAILLWPRMQKEGVITLL